MNKTWLGALVMLGLLVSPCFGETVHLVTGESINGRIIRTDDQTISVESDKGYGIIQIAKADVVLVEYDLKKRDPARTLGIGYSTGTSSTYDIDALSIKYWLSATESLGLQWGYYSAVNDGEKALEVFSLDVRYASVFSRRGNLDLYYGGSGGYIAVTDKTSGNNVDDSGTRLRAFIGAEVFFVSLPGLGISMELGFGQETIGDTTVTSLSTTPFPTFAAHYYF